MKIAVLMSVFLMGIVCGRFTDVTIQAGIDYVQQPFYLQDDADCYMDPCTYQDTTGGAAVVDYDGDGWPDIFVTRLFERDNSGEIVRVPDILYRNKGDGSFEDVTEQVGLSDVMWYTNSPVFCDVDNDGDLDLYLTTVGNDADAGHAMNRFFLFIYENGVFTEEGVSRGVAVDDGNGRLGRSAACGDYNNDGLMDLFVSQWNPPNAVGKAFPAHTRLFKNSGNGFFEDVTSIESALQAIIDSEHNFAGEFVDFDKDGYVDLLIAADFKDSRYYKNNGEAFVDFTRDSGCCTGTNDMGTTFGDLDNNGKLDWFLTSMGLTSEEVEDEDQICDNNVCGNRMYLNQSPSRMQDVTDITGTRIGGWGWGATFIDIENDGDLDVAMTNGHATLPQTGINGYLWENVNGWQNGLVDRTDDLNFVDKYPFGLALLQLDYDRDGDMDIFISHAQDGGTLLRNDHVNDNDWIKVKTPGLGAPMTNYFGKGAQITIEVNNKIYYQEMGVGNSLLGHSENTISHFGLGNCPGDVVDYIEVWFPVSDTIVRQENVPCNMEITMHEDGSVTMAELPGPNFSPETASESTIDIPSVSSESTLTISEETVPTPSFSDSFDSPSSNSRDILRTSPNSNSDSTSEDSSDSDDSSASFLHVPFLLAFFAFLF